VTCSSKTNVPRCINCQGDHLATLHECPSSDTRWCSIFSATENIPLIDARRNYFRNFPLLNTKKTCNNNNTRSEWYPANLQDNNRYSILSFSNITEDPTNDISSIIAGSGFVPRDIPRTKRLSFSQMTASVGGSVASRIHARTPIINADEISPANLLCFPNGTKLIR